MIHQPTPIKILRAKLGPNRGTYNAFLVMRRALDPVLKPKLYTPKAVFWGAVFPVALMSLSWVPLLLATGLQNNRRKPREKVNPQ